MEMEGEIEVEVEVDKYIEVVLSRSSSWKKIIKDLITSCPYLTATLSVTIMQYIF